MSLPTGTRFGPYEIVSRIGAGGMGEVYLATDTKLKRSVAIKVLPAAFTDDRDRLARFTREAQLLAALNHPNIAHVHGLEDTSSGHAMVMELVEGDDLSDVIAKGVAGLPLADCLSIARQIADALEAAHDAGVIHRDLKPANIKVRADGTVKVLDFGLAKAMDVSGSGISSETMTSPAMTGMGAILGTAAYMAPEQAKGRGVDKRADIWAFGVVLFEILSGERLFAGDTVTETIAAVIKDPIRLERLPAGTPPALRALIERCLERDPKLRLRDIGEARIALQSREMVEPAPIGAPLRSARSRKGVLGAAAAGLVALAAATGWCLGLRTASPAASAAASFTAQFVPTPVDAFAIRPSVRLLTFAPDGALIYATTSPAGRMLYRKERASNIGVPIPGTEGAYGPFVSPDGSAIGFFADGKIKHVPVAGGVAQVVHDLKASAAKDALALGWSNEVGLGGESGYGAVWLPDNTIVYGRMLGGLWRVPVSGGPPTQVTKDLGDSELAHRLPDVLPGGRSVLMTVIRGTLANRGDSTIELLNLATGDRRRVMSDATDGRYARGHLFFAREGALYSVPFDPATGATSGDPVRIVNDVMHAIRGGSPGRASGVAQYAVSDDGTLAVLGGGVLPLPSLNLAWIAQSGTIDTWPEKGSYLAPRISPDGTRVAVFDLEGVSLIDTGTHLSSELARDLIFPVWKADGQGIIGADRSVGQALVEVSLDGTASRTRIATSKHLLWASSVSRDGKWLAYVETNPVTGNDIWVASVKGDVPPVVVANTPASETHPAFSPDGKWIVYSISDGASYALYVRAFPGPGRAEKIAGFGLAPIWADDGRSLFFARPAQSVSGPADLVRAAVEVSSDRFRLGPEHVIASVPLGFGTPVGGFDVGRDGRILATLSPRVNTPAAPPPPPTLTVIFNAIR